MDVNTERAQDVLVHKKLLHLAHDPYTRPAFEVRLVQVPNWSHLHLIFFIIAFVQTVPEKARVFWKIFSYTDCLTHIRSESYMVFYLAQSSPPQSTDLTSDLRKFYALRKCNKHDYTLNLYNFIIFVFSDTSISIHCCL